MIRHTIFSDEKRLSELITAEKSHIEANLNAKGNQVAATRARSGFSKRAMISDMSSGLEF